MQHPSNAFNVIKVAHIGLLTGMILFNIVALILVQQDFDVVNSEEMERILQLVCVSISALMLIIGFRIFKKRMFAARNSTAPGEKRMERYRAACITWWAMIEGPGIVAGIGFILSHNYGFFALSIFHVVCLLVFAPRKANIIVLLNLNSEDVIRLEGATVKKDQ